MTSLNLCQVEAEKELVVEDQTTDPFIMRPSSHSWESRNWPNVEEEEDKSTSTSWESFIVWRYLLWTNSVVKKFHILKLTEYKWIGISVIWMFVSFLHVSEFITVIRLSISLLVLWLSPIHDNDISKHSIKNFNTYFGPVYFDVYPVLAWYAYSNLGLIPVAVENALIYLVGMNIFPKKVWLVFANILLLSLYYK